MAHLFGKNTTRVSSAANPITTATFFVDFDETVVVVMLNVASATSRAGGALTWAGYTMAQANSTQKAAASPEASAELWYLVNPPKGYGAVVIPNTGALTIFYTLASGRAMLGGRSAFDGANGGNNTAANPTPGAVSCTEPGDIGFAIAAGGWQSWAPSAQAGTAIANTDDGSTGGGEQYILQATIASVTLSWTFATSDDWGAVAAFFKEVPPRVLENYKCMRADSGISVGEKIK